MHPVIMRPVRQKRYQRRTFSEVERKYIFYSKSNFSCVVKSAHFWCTEKMHLFSLFTSYNFLLSHLNWLYATTTTHTHHHDSQNPSLQTKIWTWHGLRATLAGPTNIHTSRRTTVDKSTNIRCLLMFQWSSTNIESDKTSKTPKTEECHFFWLEMAISKKI